MAGALDGVKVLDLSRVLAGPTCTQLLGDLGAEIWKIENPATGGDDTRAWGPPMVEGPDGGATDLSAYFMSSNRNKKSVAIDISSSEGQRRIHGLLARADILVENFKPGGLARYGLDAATLCDAHPRLIYCSISGWGQTGPNREKPGYDIMAQGFGGIMSLTGEPEGAPQKVGVAVADLTCGMYAATGILAALFHRERTGEGQHIDVALVDSQIAALANQGANYLESRRVPDRPGNAHANIVPYQLFAASDGHVIVAVGNDGQFRRFCAAIGRPDLALDGRFATNPGRNAERGPLLEILTPILAAMSMAEITSLLESHRVPVGPVNTLDRTLGSAQAEARGAVIEMARPGTARGTVRLLGNPLKLSGTPVRYDLPPPFFGEHTEEVLGGGDVADPDVPPGDHSSE